MEDARKQDETLQAVESLARQLLQSRFQCRVAGEFFSQLGSGATALNEKENVAPKVRLEAPGLPLRELSPFPHEKNRRNRPADAALMSSIDSTAELKQSLASLQRQLASLAREEEALAKEMKKFEAPREHSIRYLMMNEELEREEQQLWHLRAEQLKPSPSGPLAPSAEAASRAGRAEAADLQRVSEDLAAELATRQREQRRLEGERQQLETHCSRLAGRLQLQRQMASNLRDGCSEALPSGTEDISAVEAEVIQLLHAAMACLAGKRPGGFPQNLAQSCQMAKSIVDGFRRELLMLLNDLCGSEMLREGASCRSLVFSVCDALRDAVLRAKGRKAPPGERGSMGTLQSTQRLVVLLQQQEEELSECLSKLKPLPVKPAAHASRPVAVKQRSPEKLGNAYPESLASTPYAEQLPSGSPKPSSPGLQQIVANAQRLQQLLELRGAAGATGATGAGEAPGSAESTWRAGAVWTEDVPLRALWKEFQACEAQLPPRLPCMVQLDQQEKNLEQLKSQLFQDSPVKNLRPKGEAWLEGVQPGTPPMLGTPGKERASSGAGSQSQDAGTPSSCLRRARSRLSQLREGLNT